MRTLLLIIDDDADFIADFSILLRKDYDLISATNSSDGIKLFRQKSPDIILLDLMLNDGTNGLEVMQKIKFEDDSVPIIIITDYSSVDNAVEAIKLGAYDYISKSPDLEKLKLIIQKSLKERQLKYHTKTLQQQSDHKFKFLIGDSIVSQKLKEQVTLFAKNDNTILITGESGVGKEVVARHIHRLSKRKDNPFLAINCAAIPHQLIESELFGHEKGSFTGADKRKLGKFEIANNGTIFLDEVSEIDIEVQVKLLRVLQEKEFERVGSTKTINVDIRIIAATNKDLKELVDKNLFRDDLYYRLDVLPIHVPPLREHKEDIPALVAHFLQLSCEELKIPFPGISTEALHLLQQYDWPGNIRELQNNIIRATIIANGDEIKPHHINARLHQIKECYDTNINKIPSTLEELNEMKKDAVKSASRAIEKIFLENLLTEHNWNISKAAESIGINRTNLHKMISKCGLKKNDY
ncbi:MAG TPA: sigma-54-dependent Fis family transcriptional regulator [Ignavibacteria bacterium]|nr:sigma-54-dependent Fis family transcriptional regulator [Ignavibacteria bacterium]